MNEDKLLDHFAGVALGGFLAAREPSHSGEDGAEQLAEDCYIVASQMMKERSKYL